MDGAGTRQKVIVLDHEWPDFSLEERELRPLAVELVVMQCKTAAEVRAVIGDAAGVFTLDAPIDSEAIERARKLKAIAVYGIGVSHVDVEAATRKGIYVINVPGYCVDEVSNHAIALLLSCHRHLHALDRSVRAGRWDYAAGGAIHRLRGATLGLVAFGAIARAVLEKTRAFGLKHLVYDPFVAEEEIGSYGAEPVDLDALLARSDYVSLHAPLTPETRHLFGERELGLMRSSAYLINTSRGGVIDEGALCRALREKRIAGAALDVMEREPPGAGHPLLGLDNLIITPHAAFYSEESARDLRATAARDLALALSGRKPGACVNRWM